jgi:hypothetical protein
MLAFERMIFQATVLAVGPYSADFYIGYNKHSKLVPNAEELA